MKELIDKNILNKKDYSNGCIVYKQHGETSYGHVGIITGKHMVKSGLLEYCYNIFVKKEKEPKQI